jgi:RNA polymerase sigma factor (sigma-70 family)
MAREPMTDLGAASSAFPRTAWSVILAAGDPGHPDGRKALERLIGEYWKPVYAYFRYEWSRDTEKAKDLTQAFFTSLLERNVLARVEPGVARFRAFLRASLSNFAANAAREERAAKRGGACQELPFEEALGVPGREADPVESAQEAFDRAWRSEVLERGLAVVKDDLVARGQERDWRVFEAAVLAEDPRPRSDEVAERFGVKTTDVTNYLHAVRKRLRQALREILLESLADPRDLDDEWRSVLGRGP